MTISVMKSGASWAWWAVCSTQITFWCSQPWESFRDSIFVFLNVIIFIFDRTGSSLLCVGFPQLRRAGAVLQLRCTGFLLQVASLFVECRLQDIGFSGCGTWVQLLQAVWDLPGPGIELVSPALQGDCQWTPNHWTSREARFHLLTSFGRSVLLFDSSPKQHYSQKQTVNRNCETHLYRAESFLVVTLKKVIRNRLILITHYSTYLKYQHSDIIITNNYQ